MSSGSLIKKQIVEQTVAEYGAFSYIFFVQYSGFKAADTLNFRKSIRAIGDSNCVVLKNTLNRVASKAVGHDAIPENLKGQIMTIFTNKPVEIAKLLIAFGKHGLQPVFCFDGSSVLGAQFVDKFSKIPSIDVLRSQLLSVLTNPQVSLVRTLQEGYSGLVRVLSAKCE